jgi:flavin-dependent dehydrogenase
VQPTITVSGQHQENNESALIKKVIILGGGTAGWLTAARLAYDHCANQAGGLEVILIESPEVKTIGVGEGSWPTLRITLRELGISETEFINQCDVSFKQGSKFVGWCNGEEDDFYYHPFTPPESLSHGFANDEIDIARAWLNYAGDKPFAFAVSAQPDFCEQGLAPKQIQTPDFAAFANYGYHLNADKFALFLQKYCTQKLGVKFIQDHVEHVNADEDEYIESIVCKNSGIIKGDLFVDCSGATGVLINKHFKAPFVDKSSILFNDTALAVQLPYEDPQQNIASVTLSTAQRYGWIWDIGLPTRRGVGHVYASEYTNDDEIWATLKQYAGKTCSEKTLSQLSPRKIKFTPGYRSTPWVKNCVAVGMSAGFVEPLEASAIVMIEICSKVISNELPVDRTAMKIVSQRFNKRFVERWDSVINFLKLHYILSKRTDSNYWTDHKNNETIPVQLKELMLLWKQKVPSTADFHQVLELFGPPSYQYILYGMGFLPEQRATVCRWDNEATSLKIFQRVNEVYRNGLRGLTANRSLINEMQKRYQGVSS